ncbi:Regulator of nonsense transcripts 2 [Phytophthora nicotianae]|uniref:Regulator of nonsense transcripts 2 n=1 Tax=Phytophthora nicotianae TaxID=4792 RepID=A0A0W8DPX5_PHYNI|nr:Regulator of nonsense transcripts 2 [Phytophthora nicotianae]
MLKLALAKSVVETKMVQTTPLPQGAVFYPTLEQFGDPIKYIARQWISPLEEAVCIQSMKGKESIDFSDPEYYRNTGWNLNNLPDAYGSLLRHLGAAINGINVPWLYCGMLFASFCWHAEDNYMSSINYHHLGAKKRWYGISSSDAEKFEAAMRTQVPERFRENPDLLLHLTTMVPPSVLQSRGLKVFTLVQQPGDIILTFPKAYHCGFSEGFNCNEAVNFVLPNWIDYGRECVEMYRKYARVSIFSHDRFVFHFGSTQNLDEYSLTDCEMLLKELRRLFHEEREYKKAFLADGLESIEELSGDVMLDERSMEVDDVRQCFRCKHNVFFSGVICSCNPSRLSCLRHTKEMCGCLMENRTLLQWVSTAELRYAIRRVQTKMRALKDQTDQYVGQPQAASDAATGSGSYFVIKRKGAFVRA